MASSDSSSSGGSSNSSNDDESERFRTAARTAHGDISDCARVRVFPPGAKVFTQGYSYIHTYIHVCMFDGPISSDVHKYIHKLYGFDV